MMLLGLATCNLDLRLVREARKLKLAKINKKHKGNNDDEETTRQKA